MEVAKSFDISIVVVVIIFMVQSWFLMVTNEMDSPFSGLFLLFWLSPSSSRLSDVGS